VTDAPNGDGRGADLGAPANALQAARVAARAVAADALGARGFVLEDGREEHWVGELLLRRSGVAVQVRVSLPPAFPDALPRIAVWPERLPKKVAHVELTGNVCLIPSTNVLIDADRPTDLVANALQRATEVLDAGLLGETDADLDAEFEAYWTPTNTTSILSLCNGAGPPRQLVLCELTDGPKLTNQSWMVADRIEEVESWANNIGAKVGTLRHGLFIPVDGSVPISGTQENTVSEIAQLILGRGTPEGQRMFNDAIKRADYPQLVVLSMPPVPLDSGRRLVAVLVRRPDAKLLKEAVRGFRHGRVPAARVLARIGRVAVDRLSLQRVDRAYVTARGGVATRLGQTTVTVVGIGAVGSEVARNLASLGIGHLRLIDPDEMNPENVHRHALGMNSAGHKKVTALTVDLQSSFPHLQIAGRIGRVEALLQNDPAFLLGSDLIVLATGEETLERRLNRILKDCPPRVHTWLEPLGIGGHAFACAAGGDSASGCFECLYLLDDEAGLINRTALTAHGQEIRRSLAGCAGTFAPFSPLDARRTAVDAAELAMRILTGAVAGPVLITWRGLHTDFEAAGYRLSGRATKVPPGARVEVAGADIVRLNCPVCARRLVQGAL
jgi:hypothetical protein